LIVADRYIDGGYHTVRLIADNGGKATFVAVDVSQGVEVEALIQTTLTTYGRLDYAHNNAGILPGQRADIATYPEAVWDQVLATNLTGVWLCMKYEIPAMLQHGGGAIVNTASDVGLVGSVGIAAYVASKHGVVGLTKTAALEYARHGIRVNCVCPGAIRTPMISPVLQDPTRLQQLIASEPSGRVGEPEEVAAAVLWLCSEAASFVTGHALVVDGGAIA
jgi:NAD(P)-dependent dehydrogenase (short-subunit alcohol dehydrogenase family)